MRVGLNHPAFGWLPPQGTRKQAMQFELLELGIRC